jgi:hypothetical protein
MVPRPLLFGEGELSSLAAFRRTVCVRSGGMLAFALARCLRVEERRVGMFRDDYASKCDRVSSQETVGHELRTADNYLADTHSQFPLRTCLR